MPLAVVDALSAALVIFLYVVLALVATAAAIGVPGFVGVTVYGRARDEDLANPAALGFGAAFFALLVGGFVVGIGLLYVG